jgi:hypothetical protein
VRSRAGGSVTVRASAAIVPGALLLESRDSASSWLSISTATCAHGARACARRRPRRAFARQAGPRPAEPRRGWPGDGAPRPSSGRGGMPAPTTCAARLTPLLNAVCAVRKERVDFVAARSRSRRTRRPRALRCRGAARSAQVRAPARKHRARSRARFAGPAAPPGRRTGARRRVPRRPHRSPPGPC